MNTISIDPPTELADLIAQAEHTLRLRQQAIDAAVAAKQAQDAERIADEWARPLAALRSALPEWIHPYIETPSLPRELKRSFGDYTTWAYRYIKINVPGCAPIAAWVKGQDVAYEVMRAHIDHDDDDGLWYVNCRSNYVTRTASEMSDGESDIAVALFDAHEEHLNYLKLVENAARRNEHVIRAERAPASDPAPQPADPIDQALDLVELLTKNKRIKHTLYEDSPEDDNADERTLVLAGVGIAIAHHLRRIADHYEQARS